jgi:hypothetical protein
LDLKTLEFTDIKPLENKSGFFHYSHPDAWYYGQMTCKTFTDKCVLEKLYRLKSGTLHLLKEFEPIDLNDKDNYFKVYDTGVVLKKKEKISVYSLPDLKPLQLPGPFQAKSG